MKSVAGLLLAFLPFAASAAGGLSVTAALSQDRLYVGEVVTLEVVCVATADGNVDIEIPEIDGLEELRRGTSDSTSISWTGSGQTIRRERTLRVDFEARKAGTLNIPPIEVQVGRESQKTAPIPLTVLGNGTPDDAPAPRGNTPVPGQVLPAQPDEGELFLRYRTDKSEAYVGEQILVDLEIFANGTFSLDETRPPLGPDGFWREILDRPDQLQARTEQVGNKHYRVYRLWRIALFGLDPGEKTLAPTQLTFSANRSIFNAGQRMRRSAPPVKLLIKPLPKTPNGEPVAGVGTFTLETAVDQTTVVPGKGALLTVTLAGAGHIAGAKLPEIATIDGFRVYPPRASDDVQRSRNGVTGSKKAEILLVPTRGGRIEIPAVRATVWNPDKGAYETLASQPIVVSVAGDVVAPPDLAPKVEAPARPDDTARALKPLVYPGRLDRGPPAFAGSRAYWASLLTPLLLLGLIVIVQATRTGPVIESTSARARRALAEARELLEHASAKSAPGDASEAVLGYASARTGVALRGRTLEETRGILREATGDAALADRIVLHLKACDFARFAPQGADAPDRALLTEARAILDALETGHVEDAS